MDCGFSSRKSKVGVACRQKPVSSDTAISASKKKGLWMGGVCPLGYDKHPDPQERTLVVNEAEAQTVRKLFELYDHLACLRAVEKEANHR